MTDSHEPNTNTTHLDNLRVQPASNSRATAEASTLHDNKQQLEAQLEAQPQENAPLNWKEPSIAILAAPWKQAKCASH